MSASSFSTAHRRLELHGPGLADLVLADVEVEALVLEDLALAHDVLHLGVEEARERRDERVVAAADVVALVLAQRLLGLTHADQGRACAEKRRRNQEAFKEAK